VLPIVSAINTEAKYLDVSYSGNLTITTPSITCITALAQGLTDITRIGNSLLAKVLISNIGLIHQIQLNISKLG